MVRVLHSLIFIGRAFSSQTRSPNEMFSAELSQSYCGRYSGFSIYIFGTFLFNENVQVGEKKFAVLVIPGTTPVIEPTIRFSVDELTEKVSGKNNKE